MLQWNNTESVRQHPHFGWCSPPLKTLPSQNPISEDKQTADSAVSRREQLNSEWMSLHAIDNYKWEVNV